MHEGTSKNVPSGRPKSVTASRWSRPSISNQYSSAVAAGRSEDAESVTSRLSAWERLRWTSGCPLLTMVPSGKVMRIWRHLDARSLGRQPAPSGSRITWATFAGSSGGCNFPVFFFETVPGRRRGRRSRPVLVTSGGIQFFTHHRLDWVAPQRNDRTKNLLRRCHRR